MKLLSPYQLKTLIEEKEAALKPLAESLEHLRRMKDEADSRAFIAAHGITFDDVESGGGKFLRTVWQFGCWMKNNTTKTWAEFNGRIYRASDLMAGRLISTPARLEHVPKI